MLILRGIYFIFLTFSLVLNRDIPPPIPWGEKWWSSPVVVSPTLHVKGEVSEQSSTPDPTSVKFRCFCLKHFSIQSPTIQSSTKVGFHIFQAVKEKERFGPLEEWFLGAKTHQNAFDVVDPSTFWRLNRQISNRLRSFGEYQSLQFWYIYI